MKQKIGIIGCGNLAEIFCENFGILGEACEISVLYDTDGEKSAKLSESFGAKAVPSIEDFAEVRPDFAVEFTNPKACREIAPLLLERGINFIPLSTGAFADEGFKERAEAAAEKGNSRVYIPSGAIGGLDLMRAAALKGGLSVTMRNRKKPEAFGNAPGAEGVRISETGETMIFKGTAKEAIEKFPQNLNVAITAALMTVGVGKTTVEAVADPSVKTNTHEIHLKGDFGEADLCVRANPSKTNPKSSELAAWSVLALLDKLSKRITY